MLDAALSSATRVLAETAIERAGEINIGRRLGC
jgi:hypothetical protein